MGESRRLNRRRVAVVVGVVCVAVGLGAIVVLEQRAASPIECGSGFFRVGARCCASAAGCASDACVRPLVRTEHGCDAPEERIRIPETETLLGPSDWEAEGRVQPRKIHAKAFAIDAFEATVGRWACPSCVFSDAKVFGAADRARAMSGVTRDEAARYCAARGGRLPSNEEWIAAAAASPSGNARRYPWGDTGAVCRRAAWGLASGPCASGGVGPDTVGSHAEGATERGVYDLAGNVAEWVAADANADPGRGLARGGSWRSALATELRTWSVLELPPEARDERVGVRCAYDID
jgi:formylglycine-generating enzyme required for sulfatase activity